MILQRPCLGRAGSEAGNIRQDRVIVRAPPDQEHRPHPDEQSLICSVSATHRSPLERREAGDRGTPARLPGLAGQAIVPACVSHQPLCRWIDQEANGHARQ